jgi:predicted nucleic acid-binding protein
MTRFAIDPATLILLADSGHELGKEHQLVAPNSIRSLALDLLLQRVRAGELSEPAAMDLHERMTEVKMRLLGDRVSRRTAWRLAQEQGLDSIQHAEYIAVAKLQADALVTADHELAAAARGVVQLAKPTDLVAE